MCHLFLVLCRVCFRPSAPLAGARPGPHVLILGLATTAQIAAVAVAAVRCREAIRAIAPAQVGPAIAVDHALLQAHGPATTTMHGAAALQARIEQKQAGEAALALQRSTAEFRTIATSRVNPIGATEALVGLNKALVRVDGQNDPSAHGAQCLPVEPKPPSPRSDSPNSSTRRNAACTTGTSISCAMRSIGWITNVVWPRFQQLTISWPW